MSAGPPREPHACWRCLVFVPVESVCVEEGTYITSSDVINMAGHVAFQGEATAPKSRLY